MTNCFVFLMFCCLKNFEEVNNNDMYVILAKGDIVVFYTKIQNFYSSQIYQKL